MATECSAYVSGTAASYKCRLPLHHSGPCASPESPRSQSARRRWEEGEAAREVLSQTQGKAQTTAEGYTDNPTPVPSGGGDIIDFPGTFPTRPVERAFGIVCEPCQAGDHAACDDRSCDCRIAAPVEHDSPLSPSPPSMDDDIEWLGRFVYSLRNPEYGDLIEEAKARITRLADRRY